MHTYHIGLEMRQERGLASLHETASKKGDEVCSERPVLIFKSTSSIEILQTIRDASTPAKLAYSSLRCITSASKLQELAMKITTENLDPTTYVPIMPFLNPSSAAARVTKFWHNRVNIPIEGENGETSYIHAVSINFSRINHSCVPNCWISWNAAKGVLYAHAIRDIGADEELLVFYDVDQLFFWKREARRLELRTRYEFECACPACDLDKGDNIAQRREDVADVVERIRTHLAAKDSTPIEPMYRQALNLMDSRQDGWEKGKL